MRANFAFFPLLLVLASCGPAPAPALGPPSAPSASPSPSATLPSEAPASEVAEQGSAPSTRCPSGPPMRVHFYDAGQALAVLVTLPDGRHVLVDAGESPRRPCAAGACKAWHDRVMGALRVDLRDARLDLLWITHQHSDHLGGVPGVLSSFPTMLYVDNGLDLTKTKAVQDAREAARSAGAQITVVDPEHPNAPLAGTAAIKLTPIVPTAWPSACSSDANACSIGLRIDYCESSVLFTGDAPSDEEAVMDTRGEVTLLQVGHHGSDTSTSASFLAKVKPKYAVISSAKPDEGTNGGYCHPRALTVQALTAAMGGPGSRTVKAFDGVEKCQKGERKPTHWLEVPASDRLWATARDGAVTLTTAGDGTFSKE